MESGDGTTIPSEGRGENFDLKKFDLIKKIGEGTYGVVYKALYKPDERHYALKKIRCDGFEEGVPATAVREIALLRGFVHPNIVKLEETILVNGEIYLVFEFLKCDLRCYLDSLGKSPLPIRKVKHYLYQVLQGLLFCHLRRVVHRDLKPQNLLVTENDVIKLADFGLARAFGLPVRQFTHEVVTLWYRAPEILLGSPRYCCAIDIWSVGCIALEMIQLKPLFCGDSEIDQLMKIFRVLGTPTEETWPGVKNLPDYKEYFPSWKANRLQDGQETLKVPMSDSSKEFILKMLVLDPSKRIIARDALRDPYFDDYDRILAPIFGEEYTSSERRKELARQAELRRNNINELKIAQGVTFTGDQEDYGKFSVGQAPAEDTLERAPLNEIEANNMSIS